MPEITKLRLSAITVEQDLQARNHIDPGVVERYAEVLADGVSLPPVQVVSDGTVFWLVDGFHRFSAYEQAGLPEIEAEVFPGDHLEAVRRAVRANATNGHGRGHPDLKKALATALRYGIIGDPPEVDHIAEALACSRRSAYRLTEPWREEARRERHDRICAMHQEGAAQRDIASTLGVGRNTVRDVVRAAERREQRESKSKAEIAAYKEVAATTPGFGPMSAMATNLSLSILLRQMPDIPPEKAAASVPEHEKEHRLDQAVMLLKWLNQFRQHLEARPPYVRH